MKSRVVAIAALVGLAWPAIAHADLILPPEPSGQPASDPPPADPQGPAQPSSDTPDADASATAEPTGDAPTDPTSSVQGPPKGGCASCRVGEPATDDATWPLVIALTAAALAWKRRR